VSAHPSVVQDPRIREPEGGSAPASVASLAFLVSFGDLERGVCSSIGHLRSRIREPEGGSAPASGASLALLVSFGDLERGVCSSIDHLRSRIREPEGGPAPASVSEFAKRFDGCPGFRYMYVEHLGSGKGGAVGSPEISTLGQYVSVHRRHFTQQSEYASCISMSDDKWCFYSHE